MEQVRPASAQAHAQQKAQSAGSAADGKPSAAEAPACGSKDGFSLLLAALGGGVLSAGDAQDEGLPAAALVQPGADLVAADTSVHGAGAQEPLPEPVPRSQQQGKDADPGQTTPVQPANLPAQVPLTEHLQMLLAQAQHTLAGNGPAPDSMVAETARSDAAAQPLTGALRLSRGAAAGLSRWPVQAGAAAPAAAGVADSAAAKGGGAIADGMALAGSDTSALSAAGKEALQTPGSGHVAGDPRVVLREGGVLGQWAGDAMAHKEASAVPVSADAAMTARSARALSEGGAQAGTQGGAGGEAGLQQAAAQQGGAAAGGAAPPAGPDGQLPGSFLEELGEQVAFWVHQKSQRAEFTLDQAGQPVQVQVTLAGDVARVTFLSDHANVRQALDAGMQDLRSLLQDQGLALADVNVGVAGGRGEGATGGSETRHPGGRRGEAHVSVRTAPAGAVPRSSAGQRALDIFV